MVENISGYFPLSQTLREAAEGAEAKLVEDQVDQTNDEEPSSFLTVSVARAIALALGENENGVPKDLAMALAFREFEKFEDPHNLDKQQEFIFALLVGLIVKDPNDPDFLKAYVYGMLDGQKSKTISSKQD